MTTKTYTKARIKVGTDSYVKASIFASNFMEAVRQANEAIRNMGEGPNRTFRPQLVEVT